MGQGLHTKIRQIAAESLGHELSSIRIMPTQTDKVPNTSPTAASVGTDLNGAAVTEACRTLVSRLRPVAAQALGCLTDEVHFGRGLAHGPTGSVSLATVADHAYLQRISLLAEGHYTTPDVHFDEATGQGAPYHYFAYGAAVSEVEVSAATGAHRVLRADLLEDVGDSVSPLIDLGQVEGGFVQGLGWLTSEELIWDEAGRLLTDRASAYTTPSFGEIPAVFNVAFLPRAAEADVVFGSKAVGEPPLMLAISVREALRDAIAAYGGAGPVILDSPATPERIYWAIKRARGRA
jgi:xanthine dehydrogenase large subunit